MNRQIFLRNKMGALLYVLLMAELAVLAAPVVPPAPTQPAPRSIFKQPSNPKEGCDPFFPYSLRPYENAAPVAANTSDFSTLHLNGISGAPNHRLVIINHVTFGVGDDAEVRTPQGRMHIHCLSIVGDSVLIEANGQRHELHYQDQP